MAFGGTDLAFIVAAHSGFARQKTDCQPKNEMTRMERAINAGRSRRPQPLRTCAMSESATSKVFGPCPPTM